MASNASNYCEKRVLDNLFRTVPWNLPAQLYLSLYTAIFGDGETPGVGTEVSGGSYARVAVNRNSSAWAAAAKQGDNRWMVSNLTDITFPSPTAPWGTVTHGALNLQASAGDHLFQWGFDQSLPVNNGDPAPKIPAGALKFYYSQSVSDWYAEQLLNHMFRSAALPSISALYVALFTTTPTQGLNNGTEVTGGSYARVLTNRDAATAPFWAQAEPLGAIEVTDSPHAINFPTPTAGWGQVTGVGFFDAATGGNLVWSGNLVSPITVNAGVPFGFAAEALAASAA